MTKSLLALACIAAISCGGTESSDRRPGLASSTPVSVRGWVHDVKNSTKSDTDEIELARLAQLYAATSLWVENADYVSGGIGENGAFVILDVPPGNPTVGFNAPGAETAQLRLQNIPGNADVLIPGVILEPGGATVRDPSAIIVRIPESVDKVEPTGTFAIVAGHKVPIVRAPISMFNDRRDYPDPAGALRPVATYK